MGSLTIYKLALNAPDCVVLGLSKDNLATYQSYKERVSKG
jgi:hypothetical protein